VSDRMDPCAGGRGSCALVAWLLVAGTGLLLIVLGNEAMHSWSGRLGDQGSVAFTNRPTVGPGTWKQQPAVGPGVGASDRRRSRVLSDRRSHSDDECAPIGRAPIAVMIACHQGDHSRIQRHLGRVGWLASHTSSIRRSAGTTWLTSNTRWAQSSLDHQASRTSPAQSTHGRRVGRAGKTANSSRVTAGGSREASDLSTSSTSSTGQVARVAGQHPKKGRLEDEP
jgi:hypothetical protein